MPIFQTARISVLIAISTATLTGCGLSVGPKSERHDNQIVDLSAVTEVRVSSKDGNVTVAPSTSRVGTVSFTEKVSRWFAGTGHCHYSQSLEGSVLVVKISKDLNAGCEVEVNLTAPQAAQVDVSSDNGNIDIAGMTGIVNVRDHNGNVNVSLDSPGGSSPSANGSFSSNNGNVDVRLSYIPASGSVSVGTDNGNAKIGLPAGTAYSLDSKVDNGSLKKDLGDTADAPFHVSLRTSNGALRVYKI